MVFRSSKLNFQSSVVQVFTFNNFYFIHTQYERSVLDAVMFFLARKVTITGKDMGDPVLITRHLSKIVRNNYHEYNLINIEITLYSDKCKR